MTQVTLPHPYHTLDDLLALVQGRRMVVLTGAGISTESGIPDYRGPNTRRKSRNPIQYKAFVQDAAARQHYWARSTLGWPRMRHAQPNAGHEALAHLEQAGLLSGIITQNVDRLHQAAGSQSVVELHGALAEVQCLDCTRTELRDALQYRLLALNPGWVSQSTDLAPDGDAELTQSATKTFRVPACRHCNGVLKPGVVFFGEQVPPARVAAAWSLFEAADVLLVAGSSLAVYSGYRFVLRAVRERKPVTLVNLGPVRGSDQMQVCINGRTGDVLPTLVQRLCGASQS